ncbi:MAG TPA: DUF2007 domain-containing protein [Aggregatilineales bacterium]|nr:DUF2007 domain-containing protein [Anaerolineales bacterium]HRE47685.1 DUF2007 domain-containing protein [Aggregatilineales bacterium]
MSATPPLRRNGMLWAVVAVAFGESEAAILAGRLQSLGIPAFLEREALGSVLPLGIGIGQIRILVPEDAYELAMAILYPAEGTLLTDGLESDGEDWEWEDDESDPH